MKNKFTGFAIALAWPQTWCKQPNAWYDSLLLRLGISVNHYYRAGHAALVLVEKSTGDCHYFDFGRYHAPFEHGRVRSATTDHDLDLPRKAQITADGKTITNLREIMEFLHQNQACHGNGDLYGSYTEINFKKAFEKSKEMQQQSPIPYGPFVRKGSNCSRFVHTAVLAGNPKSKHAFRLKYNIPLTPTPMSNVNALDRKTKVSAPQPWELFYPALKPDESTLQGTLPQPVRSKTIPAKAQWLAGEGAGSWIYIEKTDAKNFEVTRFAPEGIIECKSLFKNNTPNAFDPEKSFDLLHPSHCQGITIRQNDKLIMLTIEERVSKQALKRDLAELELG
ncbi:MAG: hypothetical protein K0B37_01170 [Bacteroidales bacterium]|nr:hypothetical protein [Bacteroidales bacterium]